LLLYARARHKEAIAIARHAIGIDPDYGPAHAALGAALVFSGCWDAGAASAGRAIELDPEDPYVHLYGRIVGFGRLGAGHLEEAAEWFQRCDHLAPGLPQNLAGLAVASVLMNDREAAEAAVATLIECEPELEASVVGPLPFQDSANWARFADALRQSGFQDGRSANPAATD
jgi:tetratricopeptide (TPR) repeat protein